MKQKRKRAAIYTRKSTDAGLEQDFNSLDAQREACEAYVKSQTQEGWRLVRNRYDDGGLSGASLERPALQRLRADIGAGQIDIVVVYKVDRLTRSLTDFAKLVELFDAKQVSFVAVTQQFNTTSSMGRLTLNVLLSFAQFEREVISERIRDKIAASKAKGIWMGGPVPLGYDVVERELVINQEEALQVESIFHSYLEVRSVRLLKGLLDRRGLVTKVRRQRGGKLTGGTAFSRGHLYRLLSNPIYIGKLPHKDQLHEGRHTAIIEPDLWEKVQNHLRSNKQGTERTSAKSPSLLAGLLATAEGRKLVPSHAVKKGRRYRYYIEQHLAQETGVGLKGQRYAAHEVEAAVIETLRRFLAQPTEVAAAFALKGLAPSTMKQMTAKATNLALEIIDPHKALGLLPEILANVTIHPAELRLSLRQESLQAYLGVEASFEDPIHTIATPCALARRGQELRFVLPPQAGGDRSGSLDPVLIQALARAHLWWRWVRNGEVTSFREIATREGLSPSQITRRFNLAFLSPELVRQIRAGTQPTELTLEVLTRGVDLPLDWARQEAILS